MVCVGSGVSVGEGASVGAGVTASVGSAVGSSEGISVTASVGRAVTSLVGSGVDTVSPGFDLTIDLTAKNSKAARHNAPTPYTIGRKAGAAFSISMTIAAILSLLPFAYSVSTSLSALSSAEVFSERMAAIASLSNTPKTPSLQRRSLSPDCKGMSS